MTNHSFNIYNPAFMNNPIVISIEGNIGSGKSTLMNLLKTKVQSLEFLPNSQIMFLDEPVEEWKSINSDPSLNILQTFYEDPKRWAYSF